tara:strand:+ start:2984 stop:3220 length:237 start_codon:yes stop_codon:yes gene_type:complete
MELKKAIGILQTHNKWRRGCEIEPMTNPTTLGIAIDTVVEYVKNNVVLDDVIKCEHTFGERGHHGDKYYACIKCGEIK